MATYAIGDVQGCFEALESLLDKLSFDQRRDRLWFCGDLVNRGPQSLETLRFVRDLGEAAVTVLGNHDLHLLAVAHGRKAGRRDTLNAVLNATDRTSLLDWLRQQPLMHTDATLGYSILHAGLPPSWTIDQAQTHAREAEAVLRSDDYGKFLQKMYGDEPDRWDGSLTGTGRIRFIVNCFTRLRYCHADGSLALDAKSAPEQEPELTPWFQVAGRRSGGKPIVFGHWSTLGRVEWPDDQVYGLDTGAVWGQQLTALRLDDRQLFSVPSSVHSPIE